MSTPIALILGAGPRVGAAVASNFAKSGYKVAIASRTGAKAGEGYFTLKADFSKPETIPALFSSVTKEFGAAPSVVVYNAATLTPPSDAESVLSVSEQQVVNDLNVNTVSPYVAAQQAVEGFKTLPKDAKKSFIYTGNALNVVIPPVPLFLTLGIGKSASAFWVGLADATYAAQGFRFFYADERFEDGKLVGNALDGPAHGEFYVQLAKQEEKVPWHATFVKGKGYAKF